MHIPPPLRTGTVRLKVPLAPYSTLGIGGPARYLCPVQTREDLSTLLTWANQKAIPWIVVGECSNVLFPDAGVDGLVIINQLPGVQRTDSEVVVGSGENLGRLIVWLNRNGLQGMERMYGIPGTVAGAVVGNAGAYGQEICQVLTEATLLQECGEIQVTPAAGLRFGYRHSLLKESRSSILLECRLRLNPGVTNLQQASDAILIQRSQKYPPDMQCPGSFFKNIEADSLNDDQLSRIPAAYVTHGKVPAGKLLEAVGANGARRGEAMVASYHGNLFLNQGKCSATDILWLAETYASRVLDRFGVTLQPEIRILNQNLEEAA